MKPLGHIFKVHSKFYPHHPQHCPTCCLSRASSRYCPSTWMVSLPGPFHTWFSAEQPDLVTHCSESSSCFHFTQSHCSFLKSSTCFGPCYLSVFISCYSDSVFLFSGVYGFLTSFKPTGNECRALLLPLLGMFLPEIFTLTTLSSITDLFSNFSFQQGSPWPSDFKLPPLAKNEVTLSPPSILYISPQYLTAL